VRPARALTVLGVTGQEIEDVRDEIEDRFQPLDRTGG
jgi:hypothetical protein